MEHQETANNESVLQNIPTNSTVFQEFSSEAEARCIESTDTTFEEDHKENMDPRERSIRLDSDVAKFENDFIYLKSEIAALKGLVNLMF